MNQDLANQWKKEVLEHIFLALAATPEINDFLIFKGALILNRHLGNERMSLDIDSNLSQDFLSSFPEIGEQISYLETILSKSISKYFRGHNPVRFDLTNLKIRRSPPRDHPRGWNAFTIKLNITDRLNADVRALPVLKIDIAAAEQLSESSVMEMELGSYRIKAYTLERIAGEKLRAFLSTLPEYREKVSKPGEAVRVKDLYDIARIYQAWPVEEESFWLMAGKEFQLAAASRFIDCDGLVTFQQEWGNTKKFYESDPTIPPNISFDEVEEIITAICRFLEENRMVPFSNPLPALPD